MAVITVTTVEQRIDYFDEAPSFRDWPIPSRNMTATCISDNNVKNSFLYTYRFVGCSRGYQIMF